MKRNSLFFFCTVMLGMTFAACSDELNNENETTLAKDGGKAVTVVVSDHGFDNATPATRATDSNEETIEDNKTVMTTEFAVGDQIGVFAINSQTNIVVNDNYVNMKLTKLSNGTWAPPSGKEFLYYQGVDYFAYYPYKDGLTLEDVDITNHTAEGFFHDYIAAFTPNEDQSTLANYTKSDLMVGQGSLVGTECQFQMKHVMGLMVIQVPTVNYTYKQVDDETNVYTVKEFYTIDKSNKAVFQVNEGEPYYRYIVRPNASELLTGKTFPNYEDGKFNVFSISHTGVDGGYYKKYVVDNATVTAEERTFKPGDVYYMDGTITNTKVSYKTVIGTVAYCGNDAVTESTYGPTASQWHGIVLTNQVYNRFTNLWISDAYQYSYNTDNMCPDGMCFFDDTPLTTPYAEGVYTPSLTNTWEKAIVDLDGIGKTHYLQNKRSGRSWKKTSSSSCSFGTFMGVNDMKSLNKPSAALCTTSSYFMPTVGQFLAILGEKGIGKVPLDELQAGVSPKFESAGQVKFPTTAVASNFYSATSKAGISVNTSNSGILMSDISKTQFIACYLYPTTSYNGTGLYFGRMYIPGSSTTGKNYHWCCISF